MENNQIAVLCQDYYEKRETYEQARLVAKHAKDELDDVKRRMVDAMLDSGIRAFSTEGDALVDRFQLRRAFSCSVTRENMGMIRDWLIETQGDDMPFVKEVVDKKALTDKLASLVESEMMDIPDFPEWMKVSDRPIIVATGWKGSDAGKEDYNES